MDSTRISFPDASPAAASKLVAELQARLRADVPEVESLRVRTDDTAQDLGQVLQLVLEPGFVTAVSGGLAAFVAAHRTKLEIHRGSVRVRLSGLDADAMERLATDALRDESSEKPTDGA